MNLLRSHMRKTLWAISLAVAMALVGVGAVGRDAAAKPTGKKLDGAKLYALNCNRCHSERYPTERTDAQWQTIMLHMRTRAQLPAEDAKAILKYLKDNN